MRTRFAPSPTGPIHLGHAFSALLASDLAQSRRGSFLLRLEDIDQGRARPHWEAQIYDDLSWLDLTWQTPVLKQSENIKRYRQVLDQLWSDNLLYPCDCNRRDIKNALSAPQEGVPMGPDGMIYPGTCRQKPKPVVRPDTINLRLDMAKAAAKLTEFTFFEHLFDGPKRDIIVNPLAMADQIGDIVVSRKDMGTSYHLSVVVDDADQGITDVVRGEDLFEVTPIHVFLQKLIGLSTPKYHHHRLIRDDTGKRLAKRDDARAISEYRKQNFSPYDIRKLVGLD